MLLHCPLALSLSLGGLPSAQQYPPVPADLQPYPVVADISFAEGPIFDAQGNLYFVNYLRHGTIGRKAPDGTVSVLCETGGRANGLKVDAEGYLIAADYDMKRLLRISPDGSEVRTITDQCDGQPYIGLNDVCLDLAGNAYFSDCGGSSVDNPIGAVYRVTKAGVVNRVAGQIPYPNGLTVSPDQKTLFVAESSPNRVVAYDLSPEGVGLDKRLVYQFPDETADGMMFDEYGRLWVCRWTHGTVDVITPDGHLLGSIDAGGTQVTNLCWWGDQLYVTVAGRHSIHRFDVGCRGAQQTPDR